MYSVGNSQYKEEHLNEWVVVSEVLTGAVRMYIMYTYTVRTYIHTQTYT